MHLEEHCLFLFIIAFKCLKFWVFMSKVLKNQLNANL